MFYRVEYVEKDDRICYTELYAHDIDLARDKFCNKIGLPRDNIKSIYELSLSHRLPTYDIFKMVIDRMLDENMTTIYFRLYNASYEIKYDSCVYYVFKYCISEYQLVMVIYSREVR